MFVACPACKSVYAIQPAHLRAGGGELRCGTCGASFNATAAVFEDARQALDYAEQQQGVAREIDDLVGRALSEVPGPDAGDRLATAHAGDALQEVSELSGSETDSAVDYFDRLDASGEAAAQAEPSDADANEFPFDLDGFYAPSEPPLTSTLSSSVPEFIADDYDSFQADDEPPLPPQPDTADSAVPMPDISRDSGEDIYFLQPDRDCYAQPPAVEFSARHAPSNDVRTHEPVPYLLDEPEMSGPGISWGSMAASLLLMVLLGGQFAWQQRYQLAETSELRPAMEHFCAALQCDLPLRREPALVDMLEREVRDHPAVKGALLINAAFINRASFRQLYPVFQISFSDVSGTLIALRRFSPEEYLLGERPVAQGMQPGEQALLALEVVDPGMQAVSFQFEFF